MANGNENVFVGDNGKDFMTYAKEAIGQVPYVKLIEVENLSETERGSGGFGSTGK